MARRIQARIREMVRHFPENGIKFLLEHPGNVSDLLTIADYPNRDRILFEQMEVAAKSFIPRDFRHIEADVVLTAPFRISPSPQGRQRITIYILIEHQSEPEDFLMLRVHEYILQIYKSQMRQWQRTYASLAGFQFAPVLPIVFYSGSTRWPRLRPLSELTAGSAYFAEMVPDLKVLFINLSELPERQLQQEGLALGWILELLRHRTASMTEFQGYLEEALKQLEPMPDRERYRWRELLTYLHALVYHYREESEQDTLSERIIDSVHSDVYLKEAIMVKRSGADALIERGHQQGLQEGLEKGQLETKREAIIRVLEKRFEKVPKAIVNRIKKETQIEQLDRWFDAAIEVEALDQLGIK